MTSLELDVSLSSSKDDVAVYVIEEQNGAEDPVPYQRYVVRGGIVTNIRAGATPTTYGDQEFVETWRPYLLLQLFADYGPPAEVRFLTYTSAPDSASIYYLLVFYPDQGILAYYQGDWVRTGENLRICPQLSAWMLVMGPPGEYEKLKDAIPQPNPYFHPAEDYRSIEDVTDLSLEAFYQLFAGNAEACFETPADLW